MKLAVMCREMDIPVSLVELQNPTFEQPLVVTFAA